MDRPDQSNPPVRVSLGSRRTSPADSPSMRSFISFDDDDGTWMFDATFLCSRWTCIFGRGCQGVLTGPAAELEQGCCSYGAHFADSTDRRNVRERARALTPEQWQHRREGTRRSPLEKNDDGDWTTRLVDDACIFLNRPGFEGGAGCALHRAALENGEAPLDWKPQVCWQLPLRLDQHRDDTGHVTWTLREWQRRDWGPGGADFHWWCTEGPEAFSGHRPVYRELADEITALIGASRYRTLIEHLARQPATRFQRHPATRPGR